MVKNLPANAEGANLILGLGDALEREMATRPSILAWEIPWTEKLCGLQFMGLQKSQT